MASFQLEKRGYYNIQIRLIQRDKSEGNETKRQQVLINHDSRQRDTLRMKVMASTCDPAAADRHAIGSQATC